MKNRSVKNKKKFGHRFYLMTKKEKIIFAVVFVLLLLYAASLIYPFVYLILNSFKTNKEFIRNPLGTPQLFTVNNYIKVFTTFKLERASGKTGIWEMFWNSISLSVVETV